MMVQKRVLFIHIDFYEYNQKIAAKFAELGYQVDCFCEDLKLNWFEKLGSKFFIQYPFVKSEKVTQNFIDRLIQEKKKYDYIFVIKGEKITNSFLNELKTLNPDARFILYLWDDIGRVPNFFTNREFYDRIFSFDRKDAEKYGLSFLPLFFCDEFKITHNTRKEIDVYFTGWDHSDRRRFIEKIILELDKHRVKHSFHLFTGRWKTVRDKLQRFDFNSGPDYLKFETLSLRQNADLTQKSKILLDIQHPTQNGLTMRTIEALAAKAKLITTNHEVTKYDFYHPNNFRIVDRDNPVIDPEFLGSPYQEVPEETVEQYSLTNWVKSIFKE